ncbi:MAG: hypothetical protein FWE86_05030, partial [Oscillospiraceae bacterium]|nr:hypothetical protein [Oscillospiraceae bacterium]
IIADCPEMGARGAINASRHMMNGYKKFSFALDLYFGLWLLLGFAVCYAPMLWNAFVSQSSNSSVSAWNSLGFLGFALISCLLSPYIGAANGQLFLAVRAQKNPEYQPRYYYPQYPQYPPIQNQRENQEYSQIQEQCEDF